MNNSYEDIRSRIAEEPKWFDEEAVPRYCTFAPRETANIYADSSCLVEITCQGCGHAFQVCFSDSRTRRLLRALDALRAEGVEATTELMQERAELLTLEHAIETRELHYGDPPNIYCCAAGPTMNSVPRRVLEFWGRNPDLRSAERWLRLPEYEVDIVPDWWTTRHDVSEEDMAEFESLLNGDDKQ